MEDLKEFFLLERREGYYTIEQDGRDARLLAWEHVHYDNPDANPGDDVFCEEIARGDIDSVLEELERRSPDVHGGEIRGRWDELLVGESLLVDGEFVECMYNGETQGSLGED